MKKRGFFIWGCLAVWLLGAGCKRECRFVSVSVDCDKGYARNYDYKYKAISKEPTGVPTEKIMIINDDSTYHALFPGNSLGTIDFSSKSLIGVCVVTNPCSSYESQGCICKKDNENKWKYTVKYSLKDQCKGSGIYKMYLSAWEIGPKIASNAMIDLQVTDVNPM